LCRARGCHPHALHARPQGLGPQVAALLAELAEAERDRQEHLQLYASLQCGPAAAAGTCALCRLEHTPMLALMQVVLTHFPGSHDTPTCGKPNL